MIVVVVEMLWLKFDLSLSEEVVLMVWSSDAVKVVWLYILLPLLSLLPTVSPSVRLSIHPSIHHPSTNQLTHPPPSIHPSIHQPPPPPRSITALASCPVPTSFTCSRSVQPPAHLSVSLFHLVGFCYSTYPFFLLIPDFIHSFSSTPCTHTCVRPTP